LHANPLLILSQYWQFKSLLSKHKALVSKTTNARSQCFKRSATNIHKISVATADVYLRQLILRILNYAFSI